MDCSVDCSCTYNYMCVVVLYNTIRYLHVHVAVCYHTLVCTHRYAAVEEDCNTALALDEGYVKAYLRRGVARLHLSRVEDAQQGNWESVYTVEGRIIVRVCVQS